MKSLIIGSLTKEDKELIDSMPVIIHKTMSLLDTEEIYNKHNMIVLSVTAGEMRPVIITQYKESPIKFELIVYKAIANNFKKDKTLSVHGTIYDMLRKDLSDDEIRKQVESLHKKD